MKNILQLTVQVGSFHLEISHQWNGSILGLVGPSGAGKTTLIEAIVGIHPARGVAQFDSWSVLDIPMQKRKLGWLPQEALLFSHLTCEQNISFGMEQLDPKNLTKLLDQLELNSVKDLPSSRLSGGEKVRTALGRAIASQPKVLLLDEPMASLDRPLRERLLPFFKQLRDQNCPIVYVSHEMDEIEALADDVIVLDGGKISQAGPLRTVGIPKTFERKNLYPL